MPTRLLLSLALILVSACAALLPALAQDKSPPPKEDQVMFEGAWNCVFNDETGSLVPPRKPGDKKRIPAFSITFQGDKFELKQGGEVVQAGTLTLDASKKPKTIDIRITEGEGKGTTQVGIYELKGHTLEFCLDPKGKQRPSEFKKAGSGFVSAIMQRELKAGVDPLDTSIVYDEPFRMSTGFMAYNGAAYDKAALYVEPKTTVVLPTTPMTIQEHDQANTLLIYMKKIASHLGHFPQPVSIADQRHFMGFSIKLDKGELLIGTYGELEYIHGGRDMKLLVLVPPKVQILRRGNWNWDRGNGPLPKNAEFILNGTAYPPPALAKSKEGMPDLWLPPSKEDGWHAIPAVPDVERRVSK